ncbi:hypothetical protein OG436_39495 (plasmid) [Streptomyces caniferus]|uniref:hypothetical protein n=1 Tax=Streptomyces TaxID=1883 RepID=UPI002E2878BD|nr:hypothetical protein [Streptomyces caniferus]
MLFVLDVGGLVLDLPAVLPGGLAGAVARFLLVPVGAQLLIFCRSVCSLRTSSM